MQTQELSIDGELFGEFRHNLDIAMKILINRMITTKIAKGAVSAKIGIELKEIVTDDGEVIQMPDISYSIGMGMSEKDSMKGNMQKGLHLRRNRNGQLLIGTEQISIDELIRTKEVQTL